MVHRSRLAIAGVGVLIGSAPGFSADALAETVTGRNISGLSSTGPDRVWAVRDDPSELLLLRRDGAGWVLADGWAEGRALHYPDGGGSPDAEAVTTVEDDPNGVYVGAERDTDDAAESRNSVLRFDSSVVGALTATDEWDLEALLPESDANAGIEGLTWIPDPVLAAAGIETAAGSTYDPTVLPGHGSGLFVVGVESTSTLFVVALFANGASELVATWDAGLGAVMDLTWSPLLQELWAVCDSACDGRIAVITLGPGEVEPSAFLDPPTGSEDRNTEGITISPTCDGGSAWVLRSDDSAESGKAVWESTMSCEPSATADPVTSGAAVDRVADVSAERSWLRFAAGAAVGAAVATVIAVKLAARRTRRRRAQSDRAADPRLPAAKGE